MISSDASNLETNPLKNEESLCWTKDYADRVDDEGQCAAIGTGKPRVSLRIVPARVSGADGGPEVETYAFLDDGSDITLCFNSLAETLGLSGKPMTFSLTTKTRKTGPEAVLRWN